MAYQPFADILPPAENICGKDKCDLSQVEGIFRNYNDGVLKNDIDTARSNRLAANTEFQTAENSSQSNYCCLLKIEESYKEYQQLDAYLASVYDQGAIELVARINALNQRSQETTAAFTAAHAAVLDLKKKAGELKDAAVKLHYAMSDPCNSEQMAALKEHIVDDPNTEEKERSFESVVSRLIAKTKGLVYEKSNGAFEISVKLAGINAYLNTAGLMALVTAFKAAAAAFKANIDANKTAYNTEWKTVNDGYILSLRTIGIKQGLTRSTSWKLYALCKTKAIVCQPACSNHNPIERLEHICHQVESGFITECEPVATTATATAPKSRSKWNIPESVIE